MVSWCSPISASMLPTVCRKVCQPTPWMPNLANAGLILRLSTAVSGTAAPTNHADVSAGLRHLLPAFDINRASASGKEVRASWSRIRRSRLGGGRVCELRRRTRLRIALASARGQHWRKRCARDRGCAGTDPSANASDRADVRSAHYSASTGKIGE